MEKRLKLEVGKSECGRSEASSVINGVIKPRNLSSMYIPQDLSQILNRNRSPNNSFVSKFEESRIKQSLNQKSVYKTDLSLSILTRRDVQPTKLAKTAKNN